MGVWNATAGSLQINLAHIWDSFDRMNGRNDRGYDSKNSKDKILTAKVRTSKILWKKYDRNAER